MDTEIRLLRVIPDWMLLTSLPIAVVTPYRVCSTEFLLVPVTNRHKRPG